MQTVQSFISKNPYDASAPTPGEPGGASSSQLSGLARAGSVVSSLSKFAMSLQQAASLDQQSRDEAMASRQEYISAQETANAIDAKYGDVASAQTSAAAASGIDVASGSVMQARTLARQNADSAITSARRTADINGNLRRARSIALKQQAGASRILGVVNLAADVASSFATGGVGG